MKNWWRFRPWRKKWNWIREINQLDLEIISLTKSRDNWKKTAIEWHKAHSNLVNQQGGFK